MEENNPQQEANQSTPPVIQPTQPQRKTKNKVFAGMILLILLTSGTYVLSTRNSKSPTQITKTVTILTTPTSFPTVTSFPTTTVIPGWKTFSNLYGAIFKYPPEWNFDSRLLKKINNRVDMQDTAYGGTNCTGDCPTFTIAFLVADNPQNLTLTAFIKNDYANSGNPKYLPPLKIEDITISNGLQFKKATGIFNGLEYFYIQHNNKIYTISAFAGTNGTSDDINDPKVQARLAVLNQVLSTFQFATQ